MVITDCLTVWIVVDAGSSPSMTSNVVSHCPLMVLPIFIKTTAEKTPTYIGQPRSGVTVKELSRVPSELDFMLEVVVVDLKQLLHIPGGTQ